MASIRSSIYLMCRGMRSLAMSISQPILVDLQSAYDARFRQRLPGIGPVFGRRLAHPCLREAACFRLCRTDDIRTV